MCNRYLLLASLLLCSTCHGIPRFATAAGNTEAQQGDYQQDTTRNNSAASVPRDIVPIGSNRAGRFFGLTTTGTSGTGLQLGLSFIVPFLNIPTSGNWGNLFGSTSSLGSTTGTTSLLNFNTGSIIFAVLIALGAIIIIPYLIYLFTGANTSPFGRSDDIQGMLNNLASRVDDALQDYNIDAPSCIQRAVCTYVKTASKRMTDGNAGSVEKLIDGLATNSYLNSLVDGTRIQQAVESGRKPGTPCTSYYVKCPYNLNTIYRSLSDYVIDYNSMQ